MKRNYFDLVFQFITSFFGLLVYKMNVNMFVFILGNIVFILGMILTIVRVYKIAQSKK